jgi:cytochrome bd-type quinol oxidase subunit 2
MNLVVLALLAAMLVSYALLDGYDLGVGAVVRLFARSDAARRSRASVRSGTGTR